MKKVLLFIGFFFIGISNIFAFDFTDTFYYDTKIPNMYVTKIKDGKLKNTATFMLHRSNSDYVYCVDPFTSEIDGVYEGYVGYNSMFGLTKEQINRMNLLSYYGYGYNNHTDLKWYGITQYLIWQTLNLDDIYFTDKYYGDKIVQYVDEINELNNLVDKHYVLPSFVNDTYNFSIKKEYVLTDINGVLSDYDIISDDNLNIRKEDNNLIIYSDKDGLYTINLVKKSKITNDYILYSNNFSQNMFMPGKYDDVYASFNVNFSSGSIVINKQDRETISSQGEAVLGGAVYELFYDNNLVDEVTIDRDGYGVFSELPLGKYYIKEKIPSNGYMLDDTIYDVELTVLDSDKKVVVYEDVIKNNYTIIKKYGNDILNNYYLESDVSFELFDYDNKLIGTYTTNEQGKIDLLLPYGNYILKQINGKNGFLINDSIMINVNEIDNNQEIELLDKEIINKGNLVVKKIGSDGVFLDGVKFRLFAKDDIVSLTGDIYYKAGELIDEVTIKDGYGYIDDLYYGNYYLKEVDTVSGYLLNDNEINIIINDKINNVEVINEKYEIPSTGKNNVNYKKIISDIFIVLGIFGIYEIKKKFSYNI